MATQVADLYGNLALRSQEWNRGLAKAAEEADTQTGRMGGMFSRIGSIAQKAAAVTAAAWGGSQVVGAFTGMIGEAGALNETLSSIGAAFDAGAARKLTDFTDQMAKDFGLVKQVTAEGSRNMGLLFKGAGLADNEAAGLSTQMVTLASDAMSFFDIPFEEMMGKLRAGITGETEPLKVLGAGFTAAEVEARALAMGLAATKSELTEQHKVLARTAIIQEKLSVVNGDLARTSGSYSNMLRSLKGRLTNFRTELGMKLLPAAAAALRLIDKLIAPSGVLAQAWATMTPILKDLGAELATAFERVGDILRKAEEPVRSFVAWIQKNGDAFAIFGGALLGAVAVLKVVGAVIGAAALATRTWAAAQALLNAVMAANPFVLAVYAIAALTAGLVLLYRRSETFREMWDGWYRVWETKVLPVLSEAAKKVIPWLVERLSDLGRILGGIGKVISGVFSFDFATIGAGFKEIFAGGADLFKGIGTGVRDAIAAVAPVIWDGIRTAWDETVWPWLQTLPAAIGEQMALWGPPIVEAAKVAWEGIKVAADWAWDNVIWPFLQAAPGAIVNAVKTWAPLLWEAAKIAWFALAAAIDWVWDNAIWPALQAAPGAIVDFIQKWAPKVWEGAKTAWFAIAAAADWVWDKKIWPWLQDLPGNAVKALSELGSFLSENASEGFGRFVEALERVWRTTLAPWLASLPGKMLDFLTGLPGRIWDIGWDILSALYRGLSWVWETLVKPQLQALPGRIFDLLTGIASAGDDIFTAANKIGLRILEMLYDGLIAMADLKKAAIEGIGRNILGWLGNAFGIGSPSKKTEQYGRWMIDGLVIGLEGEAARARGSIQSTGNTLSGWFGGALDAGFAAARGQLQAEAQRLAFEAAEEAKRAEAAAQALSAFAGLTAPAPKTPPPVNFGSSADFGRWVETLLGRPYSSFAKTTSALWGKLGERAIEDFVNGVGSVGGGGLSATMMALLAEIDKALHASPQYVTYHWGHDMALDLIAGIRDGLTGNSIAAAVDVGLNYGGSLGAAAASAVGAPSGGGVGGAQVTLVGDVFSADQVMRLLRELERSQGAIAINVRSAQTAATLR